MVIRLLFAFVKYAPKGQFCQALVKINEVVRGPATLEEYFQL
jgi:hypothetical protein